jgi:triosephosphate isomerase
VEVTNTKEKSKTKKRVALIAGNWKMYKTISEAVALFHELKKSFAGIGDREILICPPAVAIGTLAPLVKGTNIRLGAQNLHWETQGAFTGEISGLMLKEAGCQYVIIGHSERRQYFGETDESVNKKMKAAFAHGLTPIVCVGETLQEREAGQTFKVIERQIRDGLAGIATHQAPKLVIAYEPVWAIGTGKTATPQQAQEVHAFIRKLLSELGKETAEKIRILYGGSVKPDNMDALMAEPDIDGGLVGGASLKAEDFSRIVKYSGS